MFHKLTKKGLVLRPDIIHGNRFDHNPTVYYVKDRISYTDGNIVEVGGREYDAYTGLPKSACSTRPLKQFIHTGDQTKQRDEHLMLIKDRNKVRTMLSSDDVLDKLDRNQLARILNIVEDPKSRRRHWFKK